MLVEINLKKFLHLRTTQSLATPASVCCYAAVHVLLLGF